MKIASFLPVLAVAIVREHVDKVTTKQAYLGADSTESFTKELAFQASKVTDIGVPFPVESRKGFTFDLRLGCQVQVLQAAYLVSFQVCKAKAQRMLLTKTDPSSCSRISFSTASAAPLVAFSAKQLATEVAADSSKVFGRASHQKTNFVAFESEVVVIESKEEE